MLKKALGGARGGADFPAEQDQSLGLAFTPKP